MRKIGEYLLGALLGSAMWFGLLAAYHAIADQSQLSSPTTGTVSGLQVTNNYNSALNALNTCNSGTAAPTNQLSGSPSLGNCWWDTSVAGQATVKRYDGTNWVILGVIDTTNHRWQNVLGGGSSTITAAATTDLCSVPGDVVTINGSTTITSFGTTCQVGQFKIVIMGASVNITNSSSLIMPGNASYTSTAGEIFLFQNTTVGWYTVNFFPSSQVVNCTGVTAGTVTVRGGYVTHC